jgi:hypothetical protein
MAQELQEIFEEIEAQKNADPVLDDLNSTSDVAVWKGWAFITAFIHRMQQVFWDETKAELDLKAAQSVPGTDAWWRLRAFEFQYGDNIQVIEGKPQYPVIDLTKRVIKFCAVDNDLNEGTAIIKVAKDDGSGNPAPLEPDMLLAFKNYIQKIQFSGTRIMGSSQNSDLLKLIGTVYYNPLYNLAALKVKVEQAITSYLRATSFEGSILINEIIDAVQEIDGVEDFTISDAQYSANSGPYTSIVRIYKTSAGYVKIDPAFNLSTTLTYQSE